MEYRILGPVGVRDDGQPVDLGTPKQRALLALLLLHAGQAVPTDRLADLLWDGAPPARAEVSLRSYAANLRRVLPPDTLVHTAGGYRLAIDPADLDAHRFEAGVAAAEEAAAAGDPIGAVGSLTAALAEWEGPALADVADRGFARAEAARLEERRLVALERRFELELTTGQAGDALVAELERAVATHPLREGLRALLMRALDAGGRTAEALAAYADLRERLADEVGLDPSPALQSLEATLRAGRPAGDRRTEAGPAGAPPAGPVLVGRAAELASLREAFDRARASRGGVVVLRGDPGIGKTRLAEELRRHAAAAGAITASVTCLAAGDTPAFWPWAQLLRQVAATVDLTPLLDPRTADVLELVPDLDLEPGGPPTGRPPALAPDAARFQRYDAVTTLFGRVAQARPAVLVVDDVQWADPASLHLLSFLAGAVSSTHVLVVATQRVGDEQSGALREVLPALARSDAVTSIELGGLDDTAVVDLVRATAGPEADPAVVSAIVDRAGGNPFFVTELLRLEPGKLRADTVPSAVRDVVRQRVQRLDPETARLLAIAAVVGRDLDPEVLVALEGDAALDALDAGVAMHLLDEDLTDGHYRFRHALVQEVVAEPLHGLRRARLHARLARLLDAGPSDGRAAPDRTARAELARHACAGIPADEALAPRAAELCLDAAADAARELGYETSGLICERGLEAIEGTDVAPALRAALLVKLADARRAAGDPAASREACLAAAELARQAGDVDLLASAAIGLALPGAVIGMDFGVLDEVRIELLQAALDHLPAGDTALRVRLLAHLALALYLSDDRARREAAAVEAVAVADRLGEPGLRAAALAARRSTLWGPASVDERIEVARRLTELAEAGGALQTALEGHIALAIDLLEAGRLADFAGELAVVDERVRQLRQPFYAWYSRILEATHASLEGRRDDAIAASTAAMEVGGVALGRRAQWGHIGWRYVHLWDHGGLEEVEPPLRALSSAFPDNGNVIAALAHLLAETGRPDEAATVAGPLLADPASRVPEDATWLFTLTLLADAAAGIGDAAGAGRLADLLAPASGRLVVAGSAVACCGSADRGRAVALLTAGHLDEAATASQRAIDQNTRIGARPWLIRSQAGLAAVRLRQESPDEARQLLAQARAAADALDALGVRVAVDRVAASVP